MQIRSSEHFSRVAQPWSCTAAPVHDPTTGDLLGAIDLTGGAEVASEQWRDFGHRQLPASVDRFEEVFTAFAADRPREALYEEGQGRGIAIAPVNHVHELFALAARLGADVPMCFAGRAALVSGIGEKLMPAPPLPACGLLLVNPAIALSTADVFAARSGGFSSVEPLAHPWSGFRGMLDALAARGNDLTVAATTLCPAIADVLAFLRNSAAVRYAAMSGSGATCFALYDTPGAAERVAADVPAAWWRHAGTLLG